MDHNRLLLYLLSITDTEAAIKMDLMQILFQIVMIYLSLKCCNVCQKQTFFTHALVV